MAWTTTELAELQRTARLMRREIVSMIAAAGSGHPGGSLSIVEILTALYFKIMRIDPQNPGDPRRDRLVLSKGHAAPALYAALALRGFFPRAELRALRRLGSMLQGHPDMRKVPGVEISTGSLGQGLSVAVGMALAARLDAQPWHVFVIIGDGEVQEGQVWEAAMSAAHYGLDNLTVFLDFNGLQIDGQLNDVMAVEPLAAKWRAFNWHVLEIDGHRFKEIKAAVDDAAQTGGKPAVIIARTIKGRGISFMENEASWHGKAPSAEQLARALQELDEDGDIYE